MDNQLDKMTCPKPPGGSVVLPVAHGATINNRVNENLFSFTTVQYTVLAIMSINLATPPIL